MKCTLYLYIDEFDIKLHSEVFMNLSASGMSLYTLCRPVLRNIF